MRVSLKLSELDELICHICKEPACPPVYHCRLSHVTCVTCYNDHHHPGVDDDKCQICHEGEDNIVTECTTLTSLLKRMEFQCLNIEEGCPFYVTIDQHDQHLTSCKDSTFSCPVCGRGFEERVLLMEHFLDHAPTEVTYGEFTETTINPGGHLFRERSRGDYFFLLYQDEAVGLQSMGWGEQKDYEVSVIYEMSSCIVNYNGRTEIMERWPKPSHLSLRIPMMLSTKLKLKIFDEEFPCPKIEEECPFYVTIDQHDQYITSCKNSTFSCPVCGGGFEEQILLIDHFSDHELRQVTYGEVAATIISPGGYLFREVTHGDYYFLLFWDGDISLQHMEWGKKKGYEMYIIYPHDTCDMAFSGQTEVVKRWPEPSHLSLRVPMMFSNRRTRVKLTIRDNEL